MAVRLKILRYNPDNGRRPHYREYSIPWTSGLSVLEALRYIYEHQDATLAFRDYHCSRGLCGSCYLTVNGKKIKGCHAILEEGREYRVEPARGYEVIRDLVVDFQKKKKDDPGRLS